MGTGKMVLLYQWHQRTIFPVPLAQPFSPSPLASGTTLHENMSIKSMKFGKKRLMCHHKKGYD